MTQQDEARCAELRASMRPLGDELDRLDAVRAANGGRWTDREAAQYREIDGEYDQLFNELFDLDSTVSEATF